MSPLLPSPAYFAPSKKTQSVSDQQNSYLSPWTTLGFIQPADANFDVKIFK